MVKDIKEFIQPIVELHERTAQLINSTDHKPALDSQAQNEMHSYPREESVLTALSLGWILIEVAADQLMGLTKLFTEPVQTIAPWTSTRALIEASALAVWLLNPSVDVKTRVQRGFAFRYDGLSQQEKFLRAIKKDTENPKAISRIDFVEEIALGLGFPKIINKDGVRIGIGQVMPSVTEIVREELDEEGSYRLCSAMMHAHPWAISQLSFKKLEEAASEATEKDGKSYTVSTLGKNIDPRAVIYLIHSSVVSFCTALWYQFRLFGWDTKSLVSIFEKIFGELGIAKSKYFWKR